MSTPSNSKGEIIIYGLIVEGSSSEIINQLKVLEKNHNTIVVRINSAGGSVFEGIAIFNTLRNSTSVIETYIDGLAASMASVIALAGSKVYMSKSAMYMTHRASGCIAGGADDIRNFAALMDDVEKTMCEIYAKRTGLTIEEARYKYLNGTDRWMTAQEALDEKLIDGIYDLHGLTSPPLNFRDTNQLEMYYDIYLSSPGAKVITPVAEYIPQVTDPKELQRMIAEALSLAIKENDITPDMAGQLKVQYKEDARKLFALLDTLAQMRIEQLMEVDFNELDRSNLGEELNTKFKLGFELKRFMAVVGKKKFGSVDPVALLEFAIDKGCISLDHKEFIKNGFENDDEGMRNSVLNRITTHVNFLMDSSFDTLFEQKKLSHLKEIFMSGFKRKYKEKFGINYLPSSGY